MASKTGGGATPTPEMIRDAMLGIVRAHTSEFILLPTWAAQPLGYIAERGSLSFQLMNAFLLGAVAATNGWDWQPMLQPSKEV